ncbi:hypothetical protein METHB2_30053 [Candidatus Methylobacter favarea]|uniref:Endolytic peptidoglycan transglycosylase RlpA n=1 Tax=Candidatus Methylobacter favarea TaxID=2707345 RepID=A0A8S0WAL4_9GAMM|nr:septal ring lytic transglycosylase RlpA family protein [Candidatus Methylobacter favarea]CAA9890849.1 hypothetical protein METHB2_30053 [Candidatus Methylobacter favarea]
MSYLLRHQYAELYRGNQCPPIPPYYRPGGRIRSGASRERLLQRRLFDYSRLVLTGALLLLLSCTSERPGDHARQQKETKENSIAKPAHKEVGEASWYGPGFHGRETASGEIFNQKKLTAAHPTLPLGTKAQVTNLENDKKVSVTITDRGPYADDRAIDLSRAAAKKLGMVKDGTAKVKIESRAVNKKKSLARKKTSSARSRKVQ